MACCYLNSILTFFLTTFFLNRILITGNEVVVWKINYSGNRSLILDTIFLQPVGLLGPVGLLELLNAVGELHLKFGCVLEWRPQFPRKNGIRKQLARARTLNLLLLLVGIWWAFGKEGRQMGALQLKWVVTLRCRLCTPAFVHLCSEQKRMIPVLVLIYLVIIKATNFSSRKIHGCFLIALGSSI